MIVRILHAVRHGFLNADIERHFWGLGFLVPWPEARRFGFGSRATGEVPNPHPQPPCEIRMDYDAPKRTYLPKCLSM